MTSLTANVRRYKLQTLSQEGEQLVRENRAMRDEVNRLQEVYGQSIRDLEDKLSYMKKYHRTWVHPIGSRSSSRTDSAPTSSA